LYVVRLVITVLTFKFIIYFRMRWTGHVACMGEGRNVYRVLVGKPEGEDHLKDQSIDGRMGSEWTLGRLVRGGVEWIHLAQDTDCWWALVIAMMNLWVLAPQGWLVICFKHI
jgi:hypothetical protein